MAAEEELRLAWHAQRRNARCRRLSLLTLAIASGRAEDLWSDRLWAALSASHPDHFLADYGSRDEALCDPDVLTRILRLRRAFPPARIRWMLFAEAVATGPYSGPGQEPPIPLVLRDLLADEQRRRIAGAVERAGGDAGQRPNRPGPVSKRRDPRRRSA